MNECHLCNGWQAPTAANLKEHLTLCHPGQKNEPPSGLTGDWDGPLAVPVVDWHKVGDEWQAIADRMRQSYNDMIDNASYSTHYTKQAPDGDTL